MGKASIAAAMVAAGCLLTVAILPVASRGPVVADSGAAAPRDLTCWYWGAPRSWPDDEVEMLRRAGCRTIHVYLGDGVLIDDALRIRPRGGSCTVAIEQAAVLRLQTGVQSVFDRGDGSELYPAIRRFWDERCAGMRELQIDWDVGTRRLDQYARWLTGLRDDLPSGTRLTCTGLLDWLDSRDLGRLMAAVDCLIPQFYNTRVPTDPLSATRLVGGGDLTKAIRRLEACRRPYRIGLPIFEQAMLWDADGEAVTAALPVTVDQLWDAGLTRQRFSRGDELIAVWRCDRERVVGGVVLPAGSTVAIGRAQPQGLRAALDRIDAARPHHCRGVALFRLGGADGRRTCSIVQIAAAFADDGLRPAIQTSWDADAGRLAIVNSGSADLIDEGPVRLWLPKAQAETPVEARGRRWSALPGRDGVPCSAPRADGVVVEVPMLVAGDRLLIDGLSGVVDIVRLDRTERR